MSTEEQTLSIDAMAARLTDHAGGAIINERRESGP